MPKQTISLAAAAMLLCSICHSSASIALEGIALEQPSKETDLYSFKWNHGSENCNDSDDPVIQTVQVDSRSFVLRQSKCSNFEAPFMYLLVGKQRALLWDTGTSANSDVFPLYETVVNLLHDLRSNEEKERLEILILHSHRHKDHYAGDAQFIDEKNVTVVDPDLSAVHSTFDHSGSINEPIRIDLGLRQLTLISIPGHQADSVALFDQSTGWLLTGDTLYPGSIRVNDWPEFRSSIERLTRFSEEHSVSAILGGHIEMRADKNKIYSIGSTFQPNELPLALSASDLKQLNQKLQSVDKPKTLQFDKFIIDPLNFFELKLQKFMSARAHKASTK
jgi:glyoxylase-like metal-dependent hydrolase (beta-lactamase superfamily II)